MSKHTPGPWRVPNRIPTDVVDSNEDRWIADCQVSVNGAPREQQEANARLIAKAPEMYAMLKSREFSFDDRHADFYCDWCHNTASQGHQETCRLAAILKGSQ